MDCVLLDNNMFDDGGIECKTFTVSLAEDSYEPFFCGYDYIKRNFKEYIEKIKKNLDRHYITMTDCEISWD